MTDKSGIFMAGLFVGAVMATSLTFIFGVGAINNIGLKYGIAHYDTRTGELVWNEPPTDEVMK